ncbi:MAG: endonuclease, partial [Oscillospiraceae bacterium]|jgi:endonuclease-3 related protein|nr:endonuclease [Oscillospiraceae bacterium]
VEKAIARFEGNLTPERVEAMPPDELADTIRPAGFFNQKAEYLKTLTAWFKRYGYSAENASRSGLEPLREELLALRGIGKETADSILLYALELPTFVVDAYTSRLLTRLGCGPCPPLSYDAIKAYFEGGLESETALFNNLHAMIVINAKEHCRAKPICKDCPLASVCGTGAAMISVCP